MAMVAVAAILELEDAPAREEALKNTHGGSFCPSRTVEKTVVSTIQQVQLKLKKYIYSISQGDASSPWSVFSIRDSLRGHAVNMSRILTSNDKKRAPPPPPPFGART